MQTARDWCEAGLLGVFGLNDTLGDMIDKKGVFCRRNAKNGIVDTLDVDTRPNPALRGQTRSSPLPGSPG